MLLAGFCFISVCFLVYVTTCYQLHMLYSVHSMITSNLEKKAEEDVVHFQYHKLQTKLHEN
jgi:hypothetical protein